MKDLYENFPQEFLWISGAVITGSVALKLGLTPKPEDMPVEVEELRIQYAETSTTICPFCGVGCGILCFVENGQLVATEGDPDSPINEGSLCSKGSSLLTWLTTTTKKENSSLTRSG